MGKKNNQKFNNKKAFNQSEREFEDMKKRIMEDNKNVRANTRPQRRYYNEASTETTTEEVALPVSHVPDFLALIHEIVDKYASAKEDGITLSVVEGTKKSANGIVFTKLTIEKESKEHHETLLTSDTLLIYYIEDRNIGGKKRFHPVKDYQANILVINQASGNVLFNRFGYGANCIEKAKDYIDNIVSKNIDRYLQKDKEDAAAEVK